MVDERVKVLFIAGSGRSGSTVLDNILGQIQGFASVGEVRFIWERGLIEDRLCGCGQRLRECPMWREILADVFGTIDKVDPWRMVALQQRALRARHLPLMLGPRRGVELLRARMAELPEVTARLYSGIKRRTGSSVVVDSSKLPTYGFLLGLAPSIDLYVLHLVRDPRATAYSWMRRKPLPDRGRRGYMERQRPTRSSLLWTLWNTTTQLLWGGRPNRYLRVHYEAFVREPRETVERIVAFVGQAPAPLPFLSPTTVRLEPSHTVAGNPSRFETGIVEIRPDIEWVEAMKRTDRFLVTALTLPLLAGYRYPLAVRGTYEPGP